MIFWKRIAALMLVVFFSVVAAGCSGTVVAEVNNEKITKAELDKRVNKEKLVYQQQGADFSGEAGQAMLKSVEEQALQNMIQQVLLVQTAKKEGLYPDDKTIADKFKEIKGNFSSEDEFNSTLKQYGYTAQELENQIAYEAAYNGLFEKVTANVKEPAEDEMKQWYDSNKGSYQNPAKIGARTILVKTDGRTDDQAKKMAEDIIAELNKGTDFAKLAQEKSEDEYYKSDGGLVKDAAGKSPYDYGTLMPAEFDDAAMALKPGEFTKTPVKTDFGYFIIKLESLTPMKQLTFDEAKEQIKGELLQVKKQDEFDKYMSEVNANAKIVNNLAGKAEKSPANPAMPQDQIHSSLPAQPSN